MARIRAAQGASVPWEQFPPEEQEVLRPELGPEEDHIGAHVVIADALLRSGSHDPRRHPFVEQVIRLLDEWWRGTQHVELYRELWEQCRLVGAYGALDFETFWRRVSGSPRERDALQRAADMLVTWARRLDRMVVPLGAEPLLEQREAWHALVPHPREADWGR